MANINFPELDKISSDGKHVIANCDHSRTHILNLVNFGLQTAKK